MYLTLSRTRTHDLFRYIAGIRQAVYTLYIKVVDGHGSDGPAGWVGSGRVTIMPDFGGWGRVSTSDFLICLLIRFLVTESHLLVHGNKSIIQ